MKHLHKYYCILILLLVSCGNPTQTAVLDFSQVKPHSFDFLPSASLDELAGKNMQEHPEYKTTVSARSVNANEYIILTLENTSADTLFLTPVPRRHSRSMVNVTPIQPVSENPPISGTIEKWGNEQFLVTATMLDYKISHDKWQSFNHTAEFPPAYIAPGRRKAFRLRFSQGGSYYVRFVIYPSSQDFWSAKSNFITWPEFDVK